MKVVVLLLIVWALTSCGPENRIQGSVATKYGKFSYDSKTVMPPHFPEAAPSPTPKGWWPF